MANSLRAQGGKSANRDENFFVQDERLGSYDFLQVNYLIPYSAAERPGLALLADLYDNSLFLYSGPYGLNILSARKDISFKTAFRPLKDFSLVSFTLCRPMPQAPGKPMRSGEPASAVLKRLIRRSWTHRDSDFEAGKRRLLKQGEDARNSPVSELCSMLRLNFFSDLPYFSVPYASDSRLESLRKIDIDMAEKALFKADRILVYLGDTDFRPVLAFREAFKPSAKIFPLSDDRERISAYRSLEANGPFADTYLGLVLSVPKARSEQSYLLSRLSEYVMLRDSCSPVRKRMAEGGWRLESCDRVFSSGLKAVIYRKKAFSDSSALSSDFREIFDSAYLSDMQASFDRAKKELTGCLKGEWMSFESQASRLVLARLLGLNLSPESLTGGLDRLTYDDFASYMRYVRCIGSLRLRGNSDA